MSPAVTTNAVGAGGLTVKVALRRAPWLPAASKCSALIAT